MSRSTPPTPSPASPILNLEPFSSTSTTRLQALYSDFSRQRLSNPASFQANVEWWRKALETIVGSGFQDEYRAVNARKDSANSRLVIHANATLLDRVKIPRVGKPLALGTVLSELQNSHSFFPLNEFVNLKASIYSTYSLPVRIASYVVGKPLWWALEQMGVVGEDGFLGSSTRDHHKGEAWHGDYVITSLVAKAAETILEMQRENTAGPADALYSFHSFRRKFASAFEGSNSPLSDQDTKVLLKFLERDRGALVYDKDVIKFLEDDAPIEDRAITPVDKGILELKSAVHNMHFQVDSLQDKIDQCTRQASAALQKDRKPMALGYIRSRKQLQDLLTKRLGSLTTLESTLLTVEAAAGDVLIMKSYESSSATLKSILSHSSLQRENIDRTMEALAEANTEAREIDDAVRVGADVALGVGEDVDESEIDAELQTLVDEIEAEKVETNAHAQQFKLEDTSLKPHQTPAEGRNVPDRIAALSR